MSLISSSASHSSAFIRFLLARLLNKKHRNNDSKILNRLSDNQNCRIFFLRMQKMGGAIPHPIFSKSQLVFSHFANKMFARSQKMQRMLADFKSQVKIDFSPKTLLDVRRSFEEKVESGYSFGMKLENDKRDVILMNFSQTNSQWSLTITFVDLSTGVSHTFDSLQASIEVTKNYGAIVKTYYSSMSLFYANNLNMGIFGDITSKDHFHLKRVSFYHNPKRKLNLDYASLVSDFKKMRCI